MPIVLQLDPIFNFDSCKLGCLQINGFSLKVAGNLLKRFEKFKKSKPEDAIRYLLTQVAYHAQINDEEKSFISIVEAKQIGRSELTDFAGQYCKHLRILYSHTEKKEDLTKKLSDLNDIEKLHKILIIKVEWQKKQNEATKKTIASITGSNFLSTDIAKKIASSNDFSNAVSQAFGKFNRFNDLYGNSFARMAKDIQAQENLIKSSITPFYSSYANIVASLKPEINRYKNYIHRKQLLIQSIKRIPVWQLYFQNKHLSQDSPKKPHLLINFGRQKLTL